MPIIFAPVGSRGDVQPMVALAQATQALGAEVLLATAPNFAALAAEAGVPFAPLGEDVQAVVEAEGDRLFNPLHFTRRMQEFLVEQQVGVRALLAETQAEGLVTGALLITGPSVAEAMGIPFIGTALFPAILPTAEAPFPFFGLRPERPWVNRLSWWAGSAVLGALMKGLGPLRKDLGLPPIQDRIDYLVGPHPLICGFDPALAPLPGDWPKAAVASGFWHLEAGGALPEEVEAFLQAGPPPVYVGFGSMPASKPEARTKAILEGLAGAGARGIISQGWARLAGGSLPEGILALPPVSHAALFPRCALVVHHGGAGTTATAAHAGVPQLIVPHAFDQPYWASRLAQRGCAPAPLPRAFTGAALAAGIREALKPAYAEGATRLKAELIPQGAARGARIVLEHLRPRSG